MARGVATLNKYWYRFNSRYFDTEKIFLNWGYEEDPPMALPLTESDEGERYSIQLYHRTATQAGELGGKRVLEVSCGHGGGASYLMRTQGPATYTGLDLNPIGLEFCRKKHQLPGLDFVHGNAEELPFSDQSFDAVINIEASHCYARFPKFLAEVARVLRPGGHFLYADVRQRRLVGKWEKDLHDAPMRLDSERIINQDVARGVEKMYVATSRERGGILATLSSRFWEGNCRRLRNDEISYRMYCFVND